jgi:hypothetical protein
MRCENSPDNYRRCRRTATKIAIVKDVFFKEEKQSKLWICNECFNEKMFSDQMFKGDLIQVIELNK